MKSILVRAAAVVSLVCVAFAAHAADCGADGDGSSMFYCESANHDVSIDGLFNNGEANTATMIFKRRDHGMYAGAEEFAMVLGADSFYSDFKTSGTSKDGHTKMSLIGIHGSVHEICPGDSATFKATLTYKGAGVADKGQITMSCSFYLAH